MTDADNEVYFIVRYAEACVVFPLLGYPTFTHKDGVTITTEELNAGGLAVFNLPPGFDVKANDEAHHVCKHEAGHAYLRRLERVTGIPRAVYLDQFRLRFGYGAGVSEESWAEVFCNACEGKVVTSKSYLDEQVDPLAARAWFQALNPATLPPKQKEPALRTMYDSTKAADIPTTATMVGGYVDGSDKWSDADWARFPNAQKVRICIFNDRTDADVIDIESGNNNADGAVPWVRAKWLAGSTPIVYCSTDVGPVGYRKRDVIAACTAAGVKAPLFWVALYDNDPTLPPGVIAKQYADPPQSGGHYDLSIVGPDWPGMDGGNVALNPVTDAAAFRAMFLAVYGEIGVSALFDALKAVDARQQSEIDSKANKTHPHTAATTVS